MYLGSQFLLLLSAAAMGNSLDALTGKMYEKGDPKRDGGYSILYIMNNIGAIAPVITGTIAQATGYHMGFLLAAILRVLFSVSILFSMINPVTYCWPLTLIPYPVRNLLWNVYGIKFMQLVYLFVDLNR